MIKKGIKLDITSWENDGDHYNTKSFTGLDLDEAKFMIDMLQLFSSSNKKGFGNANEDDDITDEVVAAVTKVVMAHKRNHALCPDFLVKMGFDKEVEIDAIREFAYEAMGCSEHYQFRVYESYKAHVIPEDIQEIKI
jgi:hypothetical protein